MGCDELSAAKADILIVDDTPANLRLLSKMLREQGYRARPVLDGSQALEAVRAEAPDLILLDIRMPGMDGYEVCEHLKAEARTRDIPVIFISALDATQDKVRAFGVGGVDYVAKPFQVEEVLARVETHLALRRLQRELQDANARMARELALAGEVQTSFLPRDLPRLPGWDMAATLRPARETSGDFYDFFSLPNGRLGIVIADVSDKGAGAALLMALSCALIRTYAAENDDQPHLALNASNRRILADTASVMFVTTFLGYLDPASGKLNYCNAGHNPPYLCQPEKGEPRAGEPCALQPTGPALGMLADADLQQGVVQLDPGDLLVLYTDGVTEARGPGGAMFGEERLLAVARAGQDRTAQEVQDAIIDEVRRFAGDVPQSDDIALIVIVRGAGEGI